MLSASKLAYWEGVVFLFGLAGIVFWKLMNGGISLDCLLYGDVRDKNAPSGYRKAFSPGRSQMLMITVLTAGYYLLQVIHNPKAFPQIPTAWVAALGGSHAIYLGGKATSMLLGRLQDLFDRRTR